MVKYAFEFRQKLADIPLYSLFTNAQYQGWMGWDKYYLLPSFDSWKWVCSTENNTLNPLASHAVKCAWKVTTVSSSYMDELRSAANGSGKTQPLNHERGRGSGILTGIDTRVWDLHTDTMIAHAKNPIRNRRERRVTQNTKDGRSVRFGSGVKPLVSLYCSGLVQEPMRPVALMLSAGCYPAITRGPL